jgi:hypothetical protein
MPKELVCLKKSTKGLLGIDFLTFDKRGILLINFTNNLLKNLSYEEKNQLISEGFKEIKSKISFLERIFIYLNINGKEYKMNFDTGNTSNLVLPYKEVKNFQNFPAYHTFGSTHLTVTGLTDSKNTNYYSDVPVSFGNENVKSGLIVTENLNLYNVGLSFIKGFDWIIDYKKKKVYYRKNNIEISVDVPKIEKGVIAQEGKLKFMLLGGEFINKYNIGDEIVSVNGEAITTENICEMQNLLNQTKDWDSLNVLVKKN